MEKAVRRADAHGAHLGDIFAVDPIVQRVWLEARAVAIRAHEIGAIARQQHAHVHAVALALETAKPAADALIFTGAFDDQLFLFVGQLAPGLFRRYLLALAKIQQTAGAASPVDPRFDGTVAERFSRIGDHQLHSDADHPPTPPPVRTGRTQR